jgi:hypothetical protein
VTAPLPTRTSPIAGFTNALYRLYIRRAAARITEQRTELAALTAQQQRLKGATTQNPRPTSIRPGIHHQHPTEDP